MKIPLRRTKTVVVVSVSGGKDSTASALLAIERFPAEARRFVFADTGNEHEMTYEYVNNYLPRALGVIIDVVRADFTGEIIRKRENLQRIANGELESVVYGSRVFKHKWTKKAAKAALKLLHPTGNPYLDLCMSRGGFPSRKRQYCTEYLKTLPLTEYCDDLLQTGFYVESWQGVRADESFSRRDLPEREQQGGGYSVYRPILRWTALQVFAHLKACGIKPNPLYKLGMSRVGCMPCINASDGEVLEIAKRFPEHVKRIHAWEKLVSSVCRYPFDATFFHNSKVGIRGAPGLPIPQVIKFLRGKRGSLVFDESEEAPKACSSSYGLCE